MLKKLTVSNLAIVERVEVDFASGLNVITGETGAGKSVLMGALDLVLGGRADASVVRDGAKEAEVEAVFFGDLRTEGKGGACPDEVVIRRTVTASGRSRAWIDDESVSIAELRELGAQLVDIHGPTANQRLLDEDFQRETIDACGKIDLSGYAGRWADLVRLNSELETLLAAGSDDELDMLRFQVNELEGAALSDDDATLGERHAAAAHAEEIVSHANAITDALGGDESAAEILIRLQPRFAEIARHLPSATDWSAEAEELTARIQELSRTVADAAAKIDVGEENLEELDARLTLVSRLQRKYRAGDVPGLLAVLAEKKARLDALEHREERVEGLRKAIGGADAAVRKLGGELSRERRRVAERFAKAVMRELKDLGFLQAKFSVRCDPVEPGPHGMDRIVYMFEPNPGESSRPLAAIASSGEIARVMLALKVVASGCGRRLRTSPTLVFDEIDANIGGEIGKAVGEKLRAVAGRHQVVAITHLPQTAAYGERHLVVSKSVVGGRTRTGISVAEGDDRVSEIARMLGGEKLTSVVRRHAEELLELSR